MDFAKLLAAQYYCYMYCAVSRLEFSTTPSVRDYTAEQMLPIMSWGTEFATTVSSSVSSAEMFKIVAAEDDTTLSILNSEEVCEILFLGKMVQYLKWHNILNSNSD